MKKLILVAFLAMLFSGSAIAKNPNKPSNLQSSPTIVGYIANEAKGRIVLTTEFASCKDNQLFFYAVASGGKIVGGGCYRYLDGNILAEWMDDGSIYQYPFDVVNLTDEWINYINNNP